ncbi:DUF3488 domain-containing protein [Bradyrhizobium australiense]|uniref:Glycosyltransferase RgtA/B/C/D-like domain-containing protein n=1 Tax=Bradyrhizobium australiense TaxID=2721161 RepID=A0A7Y4GPG4_9BRAD|nr:hypothetical protein [Bradyrhizobium australiense]NOJ39416.1 hypothetical protein [Bradyrhizobium australiense]
MSLDIGLGLPGDETARQGAWTVTPLHAVVAVFMVAIILRGILPFNVDVSWWLIVCERMLDGQRLYVDILETNPPMAGAVYFLGVALARAIHARPEVVTNGLIFLSIATSLALTWRALRFSSFGERARRAAAVWAAALLAILPMYDFGQREHLALVLLLPALAVYVLRANGERVTPSAILIAGLCAATTMNFKPYFVFAVGFCILTAAAHARDWRVLFAPENWIAAALVVIHALCIVAFYPEYFTLVYPLVRDVYLLLKAPLLAILLTSATLLWLVAIMVVLAMQSQRRKVDAAAVVMMAGSLGFAISFFVQGKGWGYHAYPMVALGLLAAGWAIAASQDERAGSRRLRAGAMLVVALIFANACLWFNASVDMRRVQEEVTLIGPRPKILMLSAAAVIGHPMVRELQGTWVSRQEALWVREIVRRARLDGSIDQATADRLAGYVARERAGLIEDFRKQPPDVVVIDNQDSDWGSWAAADPELSQLLKSYALVKNINGIEILRRVDQTRS